MPSDLALRRKELDRGASRLPGLLRWRDPRGGDQPSYDVLVYCDLKTTRSYELGEPVPEVGEGLYVALAAASRPPSGDHRSSA